VGRIASSYATGNGSGFRPARAPGRAGPGRRRRRPARLCGVVAAGRLAAMAPPAYRLTRSAFSFARPGR